MWIEIILEAIFWALAIMGFVNLAVKLPSLFWGYGKNPVDDVSLFISISGSQERLEYIVRSLRGNLEELYTKRGGADIYLVDMGMDRETFLIASSLCDDYENLYLCHSEEIGRIIIKKSPVL